MGAIARINYESEVKIMATKFEKLLRGPLSGKNHNFGNYLMEYPQFNDTLDGKQRVLLNEDGTIRGECPILRR